MGADRLDAVLESVGKHLVPGASLHHISADLSNASACKEVIEAAREMNGSVEILVCNQARSGFDGSIFDINSESLDAIGASMRALRSF